MKRRVAILGTRGYPSFYGGFETAVRRLAPYLAEREWDVTVYGRKGTTAPDDFHADDRVRSVLTPGLERKSLSTLTYGFSSCLHAMRHPPDVALIMNVANGFWIPLLKLRGIPTVVNVDGIEWERAKWGTVAKTVFKAGARMTAIFATELVADAHAIGQRWLDMYSRESTYIPYGGDEVNHTATPDDYEHRSYVLVVARFVPENTVGQFLEAVSLFNNSVPVVIVGSSGYGGELEQQVRELVASNSNVTWLGHVSDDALLARLWQHAGVYFHGHSVGGTNPALVQAMACGAPIVARDTVYNREVLGPEGSYCLTGPLQIKEAILNVLASPEAQQNLSTIALRRAREKFTWDKVCSSYEKLLRETMRA